MELESTFNFNTILTELEQRDLLRQRKEIGSPQGPQVIIDGQPYLNFCSNDYLGLANDERLVQALAAGAAEYGVGSGASQLVCGRHQIHAQLEGALAQLTGRDRALVFSSGYLANLSVITALGQGREDLVIEDHLCHASLIDGAQLSRGALKRYPHGDMEALGRILADSANKRKLVLTDGVFSMDGDIAPVAEIAALCRDHRACLVVDDAHGFGVLGPNGLGVLDSLGLGQEEVPLLIGTFGKALGCFGAFAAGSEPLIEMLIQRARPYIYTTALPPALAAVVLKSLQLMQQESWRRERIEGLVTKFRARAKEMGLPVKASVTPIQPLILGESHKAVEASDRLFEQGILVTAIRPPTVPEKRARLRITLTAGHSDEHLQQLLEALAENG